MTKMNSVAEEKKYECIFPDGKIVEFNTLREISEATQLEKGLISRYLNGKRKTIGARNPGRPAKGIVTNTKQQGYIIRRLNKNIP